MLKGPPATIEMGGWRYCKVLSIGHTKVTCLGHVKKRSLDLTRYTQALVRRGLKTAAVNPGLVLDTNVILGRNFNFSVP